MKREFNFNLDVGIPTLIIIAVLIALLQPFYEARTFNRCTGSNVGYVDAMFAELRIENCQK